ncbi:MAG: pseudouridine synthase [Succinivibrio sp.]|nr:pseudouridine synthase [Succinivibrio sp.]
MASDALRLDKAVSHSFDVPRSHATALIKQGRVLVNGEIRTKAADKILLTDTLEIDGYESVAQDAFAKRYFMLNKPSGFVCADSDNNFPIVLNLFGEEPHRDELHCVGRLDADTTGLLLVTDDGQFNHKITSPKYNVTKTYHVACERDLSERDVKAFAKGLRHPEEKQRYKSAVLEILDPKEALVTVTEGRFHEVKRLFECINNTVTELSRIRIGRLELDKELEEGEYRELTPTELELVFADNQD